MLFGLISAIKHGKQRPIGDSEISDERESGNRARIFIFLGVLEVSLNLKSPPCFAVFLTYLAHIPILRGWYNRDLLCCGVRARVAYIN